MKINEAELMKQLKKEYLKGDGYVQFEIIVKENEPLPYCSLDCNGITTYEIMQLLSTIDEMKRIILEKNPDAKAYKELIGTKAIGEIKNEREN